MGKPDITEATEERTIRHKAFRYFIEEENPVNPGTTVGRMRIARAGETVKLRPVDARRGDALGAFFTEEQLKAARAAREGSPAGEEPAAPDVDLTDMDEGEIRSWLEGNREGQRKPSIPQVLAAVSAVEDDDDRAEIVTAVKEAEESADHDTRSSLIEKLDALSEDDSEEE